MPEISKPEGTKFFVARSSDGSVLHIGETQPNQVTTTGQPVLEASDTESEQLDSLTGFVNSFPDLPIEGELQAGSIYKFGGELYKVRQSHTRTIYDPKDTPALFFWVRPDGSGAEWAAGEEVTVGLLRSYSGSNYKCIQAHVTQTGWEPPNVPALWALVVIPQPTTDWAPGQVVAVGDLRMYNGTKYRCRQAHTTQAGWTPPAVPALWEVAQ